MNTDQRKLKLLAERHTLMGQPLTADEIDQLKTSKYNTIVDDTKVARHFDNLVEQYTAAAETIKKAPVSSLSASQREVRELLDEVEDRFNLDVTNLSHLKYKNADIEAIKRFVIQYATDELFDANTLEYLNDLVARPNATVYDIFYSLFSRAQ